MNLSEFAQIKRVAGIAAKHSERTMYGLLADNNLTDIDTVSFIRDAASDVYEALKLLNYLDETTPSDVPVVSQNYPKIRMIKFLRDTLENSPNEHGLKFCKELVEKLVEIYQEGVQR